MKINKVFILIFAIIVFLAFAHFIQKDYNEILYWRFNLDKEANIPTWFSSSLLLSVGITSFLNVCLLGKDRRVEIFYWAIFGSFFTFLSLDETARLHEIIDQTTDLKWVYAYIPIAASIFIYSSIFFYKKYNGLSFVLHPSILGLFALGVGGMGGELVDHHFNLNTAFLNNLEIVFEETFEMLGATFILAGCMKELKILHSQVFIFKQS